MPRSIPLTKGRYTIVDDDDYEWLSKYNWCYRCPRPEYGYAITSIGVDGKQKQIQMHRIITNAPDGLQIDHRDGNSLNNTRANLRLATASQNGRNRQKKLRSRGQYKGITFLNGKWMARIRVNGVYQYLGCYTTELEAARVYDNAARLHFGEFARLNFPEENAP